MRFRRWCITFALCLATSPAVAADQQEIVSLCRDGHLQARAAIRQLHCDIEVIAPPDRLANPFTGKLESRPADVQRYTWWEDQGVARCRGTFGGITEDFIWKNNTLKVLKDVSNRGVGNAGSHVGRLDGTGGLNHVQNVWHSALFYDPEELRELMTPSKVVSASEEVQGGARLYRVTVNRYPSYQEDIFFQPGRNYLVTRVVGYPDPKMRSLQQVYEAAKFTEPKPGIYFPSSVQWVSVLEGKSKLQTTSMFKNVRVNEAIDPSKLQLRFPEGTQVTDTRSGKVYTVGPDEQPIGREEPMGKPRDLSVKLQPTAMQPGKPWWTGILWSLGGITIAVLAAIIFRRRRTIQATH